jgi:hypothetical protein
MLLQRVWSACRLGRVRRLGMLGGTLASCALALATVVPSAYALACGVQNHHKTVQTSSQHVHKTTQTSNSHAHGTSDVRYVYVYKCSCGKDQHSSSDTHHSSGNHGSDNSGNKGTDNKSTRDKSTGGHHHSNSGGGSNGGSKPGQGGGSSGTPNLPFTGSDPD